MADLASLYIKIDSKGVVTASKELDNLTGKSKKTEKATEAVTKSFSNAEITSFTSISGAEAPAVTPAIFLPASNFISSSS